MFFSHRPILLPLLLCFLFLMPLAAVAAPPARAVIQSPTHNAYDVTVTPRLLWRNGGGATSYRVYFGTTSNLGSSQLRIQQSGTSYTTEQLAYNTTYYWRIDSINNDGTTTGDTWRFRTYDPNPQYPGRATSPSPANNATEAALEPRLTWSNGGDARSYDVYFGTSSSLGSADKKTTVDDLNRFYEPGTLDYNTTYYWRIDSINPRGTTAGTTWRFRTKATPPPSPPFGPNPADGQTDVILTGSLSWFDGGGATSYDVYFGDDSTPDSGERMPNQTGTTFHPGTLRNNKTYYWKIVARNDENGSGGTAESPVWSFRTQAAGPPPPGPPAQPIPAHGASERPVDQLLGWTDGGETASYDVYLGTASSLGAGDLKASFITGTAFNPGALAHQTTYYWRIDARNDNGVTEGATWSFTTVPVGQPPLKPTLNYPPHTLGNLPLQTDVQWNASDGATSYDIYFGTNPTLGPADLQRNLTGLFFHPGTLAPLTRYYWRVDARNQHGVRAGDVWNFATREAPEALVARTRDFLSGASEQSDLLDVNYDGKVDVADLTLLVNNISLQPALLEPAGGAVLTQPQALFRWTTPAGAKAYQLELRLNDDVGQANRLALQFAYGPELTLDLAAADYAALLAGQTVRWSVRAMDLRGDWSAWTPLASFTYQPE